MFCLFNNFKNFNKQWLIPTVIMIFKVKNNLKDLPHSNRSFFSLYYNINWVLERNAICTQKFKQINWIR